MHLIFCIHSSVLVHLSCSSVLAVVPRAAMIVGVQVSFKILLFILDLLLGIGFLGHWVLACLVFKRTSLMCFWTMVGGDSWESLGLQGDPTSPFWRRSALGVLWKEWCLSWNSSTLATSCEELTHWKRLWWWDRGQEEKGTTEDEMAGWHHWLDARESEWTPRVGDGQGGLVCCASWGHKESDTTERLNWTELMISILGDANKWSLPDTVPLKAVEHQVIWGRCSSPPQTLRPHHKPEESECGSHCWVSCL